jgi:PAS domain S-box-containing protein
MKILFLEDDPNDLEIIQRTLKKAGLSFSTLSVSSKEAYQDALKVFKPDVVLSDHSLPQFDSVEALSILKESGLNAVFILVTGTVSEEFAVTSIKNGVDDYILKSNLIRLPTAIERALLDKQKQKEKKLAEQQLREKSMFLSWVADSLPVIYYLMERDTHKVVHLNGNIKGITGYDPSMLGNDEFWHKRVHPDDAVVIKKGWMDLAGDGKTQIEYRVMLADRSYRWFYEAAKVITLEEKQYVCGVIVDITGIKSAEDELRRSEERWRALIENSSDIITLMDKDGTILYKSPSEQKLLGYTPEELIGKNIFEYFHNDDIPRLLKLLHEKCIVGGTQVTELKFRHKQGHWVTLEVTCNNLLDNDEIRAIVINSRDITERKKAEMELEREKKFLEAVLDNINVGVLAFDDKGNIILFNKAISQMPAKVGLDIQPTEWMARFDIYTREGDLLSYEELPIVKILSGNKVSNEVIKTVAKETGIYMWLMVSGQPVKNFTGMITGAVMGVHDITDLKSTEEKLRSKVNDLDTFIYRTSHDLKSPLSSVQGLVNLALEQVKDPTALQMLEMIGECNEKLEAILSSLTEVTHVLNAEVSFEPIELKKIMNDLREKVQEAGMSCSIEVAPGSDCLYCDRTLLQVILRELVDNAVKYRKAGSSECAVTISGAVSGESVILRVEDNGQGIPVHLQEKVFDLFFRANNDVPGTGLGLFIVKNAVEKLNGKISLESNEGAGTIITIVLPSLKQPA